MEVDPSGYGKKYLGGIGKHNQMGFVPLNGSVPCDLHGQLFRSTCTYILDDLGDTQEGDSTESGLVIQMHLLDHEIRDHSVILKPLGRRPRIFKRQEGPQEDSMHDPIPHLNLTG